MKNKLIPFLITILPAFASAQDVANESKVKFGFDLGVNYSNLQISTMNSMFAQDIGIKNGVGGRMGILVDYAMSKRLSLTFNPEMGFNSGRVSMSKVGDEQNVYTVLPTTMEISTHFNYRPKPDKPGPYLLFGPSVKVPLNDNKNSTDQISRTSDLAIDLGVGMDKIFPHFQCSPELRYSYGLMNLSNLNEITRLNMHSISLVFNFKG